MAFTLFPADSSGCEIPRPDCASSAASNSGFPSRRTGVVGLKGQLRGVTLVEAMFSLGILAMFMLGFLGTFVQSRRVTEGSVLHAAATSMIYGIIEQIKQIDYANLPNNELDPAEPTGTKARPYVRVRIDQNNIQWLSVKKTDASTAAAPTTPQGPTTTPAPGATATDVGAIDNLIGSIPLSTVTGTTSQEINLNIWVWVDEIAAGGTWSAEATAPVPDASEVKKVTVVYTYQYQDGSRTRTIRDREVFLRTRYDQ